MTTVAPSTAQIATAREVEAKPAESGELVFMYIDVCACTLRTVAFRRPTFKQKKGSATISLGLYNCSMGSSQSPSRDTVPLNLL
jgi:hypothetical protein